MHLSLRGGPGAGSGFFTHLHGNKPMLPIANNGQTVHDFKVQVCAKSR
jgi:hypothetical protein